MSDNEHSTNLGLKILNVIYLLFRTAIFGAFFIASYLIFFYFCSLVKKNMQPTELSSGYYRASNEYLFIVVMLMGCAIGIYWYERRLFMWISKRLASMFSFADTDRVWAKPEDKR